MDRDLMLEKIGKRMMKLHRRSLSWVDRFFHKQVGDEFWQAMYYYNPNMVYTWNLFSEDKKLLDLGDEYIFCYGSVKARILRTINMNDLNNVPLE